MIPSASENESEEGEGKKVKGEEEEEEASKKYKLRGIVVHSGQASGGHYYSFIHIR